MRAVRRPPLRKLLPLAVALSLGAGCDPRTPPPEPPPVAEVKPEVVSLPVVPPAPPKPERQLSIRSGNLERNELMGHALERLGAAEAQSGLMAALGTAIDFRKLRVGDELTFTREAGALIAVEYRRSLLEGVRLTPGADGRWEVERRSTPVETRVRNVEVTIRGSMYESLRAQGHDPDLALALADVFAWDIDFRTEVQNGDVLRAVVEERRADGRTIGWGEVFGAEYVGRTLGTKALYRWQDEANGGFSYFGPDGTSARRAFLKSPLKYSHVTSGFGSRFHPILQYVKQHAGVDYAAAIGTPVWAVGDGTVTIASYRGASGNLVCVKHRNGLTSCYAHLSAFGEGVRVGSHVAQKQVIGLTGTTGRSTGPHLHYAIERDGQFINPLSLKFPPAEPIPAGQMAAFLAGIDPVRRLIQPTALAAGEALALPSGGSAPTHTARP